MTLVDFLRGSKGTAAKTVSHCMCVRACVRVCACIFIDLFNYAACLHLGLLIVVLNVFIEVMGLRV